MGRHETDAGNVPVPAVVIVCRLGPGCRLARMAFDLRDYGKDGKDGNLGVGRGQPCWRVGVASTAWTVGQ
ncbi:hypothetical protein GCM10022384_49980 [Streptomyces marokkonensis]|uniref:Uncharacterized protein n=1 Tax=Streptomyces marokkonensis TaxID=324855 RepID=A0ABP7RFK8_9ACTN